MKTIFEELNELYNELEEANNNFSSDHAKTALLKKYNAATGNAAGKSQCILHHLNGNHNDDADLANDLLIVGNSREEAKAAHKIIHLLSYTLIADYLEQKLNELDVDLFYQPDYSAEPQPIDMKTILHGIVQHNKQLRDIALLDQDEETLDELGHNNIDIR